MHYYLFNLGDYRRDTIHLSRLEHSIYRDLIDWYFLDEKPIPNDEKIIYRKLRLTIDEEKEALVNVLNDFFLQTDDGWFHRRIEEDIAAYYEKSEKARESVKKRWEKEKGIRTNNEGNTDVIRTNNECNTNQKPITNNQEPINPLERGSKILTGVSANEKNDADASPAPAQPPPVSSLKLTQTHIQQPFRPTEAAVRLAEKHGLDIGTEADLFVAHYESTGEVRANWDACFRKWLMRSMQHKAETEKRSQGPPVNGKKSKKFSGFDYINGGDGYGNKRKPENVRIIDGELAVDIPKIQGKEAG